jgi:hypothetical protein
MFYSRDPEWSKSVFVYSSRVRSCLNSRGEWLIGMNSYCLKTPWRWRFVTFLQFSRVQQKQCTYASCRLSLCQKSTKETPKSVTHKENTSLVWDLRRAQSQRVTDTFLLGKQCADERRVWSTHVTLIRGIWPTDAGTRHASHVSCSGPEIFMKPSSQIGGRRPGPSTRHPKARVCGSHLSVSLLGSSPLSIRNLPYPIPLLRSASSGELWRVEALRLVTMQQRLPYPHFFPLGCFPSGGGGARVRCSWRQGRNTVSGRG